MTLDTAALRPRSRDLKPGDVLVWTGRPRNNDLTKVIDRRKDDDTGWWMTDGSGLADYAWDGGYPWTTVRALCDAADAAERVRWRMGTSMFVGHPMTEPLPDDAPGIEDMWAKVDAGIGKMRLDAADEVERLRVWLDAAGKARKQVDTLLHRAEAERDASRAAHAALERVLATRERELLDAKGPCSNGGCRLHYAHSGPCDERPLLDRHAPEEGS